MPVKVRMPKRLKHRIGDRSCLGGGSEAFDLETGRFGGIPGNGADREAVVLANPNPDEVNDEDDSDEALAEPVADNPPVVVAPVAAVNAVQNVGGNSSGSRRITGESSRNQSSAESSHSSTPSSNHTGTSRTAGLVARGVGNGGKKPDFMELMILQMNNEAAERAFERRERAEERRHMTTIISTLATSYFGMKANENKKRSKSRKSKGKKRRVEDNDSPKYNYSSSEDDSTISEED